MGKKSLLKRIEKSPPRFLLLAYLIVIAIGTLLLLLPISRHEGIGASFVDALFVSTSATCVTGLTPVVTATHWTLFGKVVILILIQLGGLGIMTAVGGLAVISGQRIGLGQRLLFMNEKNEDTLTGIIRLLRFIVRSTFLIEGIGAILLLISLQPRYGWLKGLGYSIFLSVSSFCNAGFDPLGPDSLLPFQHQALVLLPVAGMIIIAGLGYVVYLDFIQRKHRRSLQTRVVVWMTAGLLLAGTLITLLLEAHNPLTLGPMSLPDKLVNAFFHSTSLRTAGFFTFPQEAMRPATALFSSLLMFIGGSPGGTAGGLKTTTMVVLVIGVIRQIRHTDEVPVFHRNITRNNFRQATLLLLVSFFWIFTVTFFLQWLEEGQHFLDLFFETMSAYGTVGLSRNLTANLHSVSKVLISITMLFGKIGPVTMLAAIMQPAKFQRYHLAEESMMIG